MPLYLHLQNLSELATNEDIRRFLVDYDIAEGGVQILGGPNGDAFITFQDTTEILSALDLSGQCLLDQSVTLRIIARRDMDLLFNEQSTKFLSIEEIMQSEALISHSGANQSMNTESDIPSGKPCVNTDPNPDLTLHSNPHPNLHVDPLPNVHPDTDLTVPSNPNLHVDPLPNVHPDTDLTVHSNPNLHVDPLPNVHPDPDLTPHPNLNLHLIPQSNLPPNQHLMPPPNLPPNLHLNPGMATHPDPDLNAPSSLHLNPPTDPNLNPHAHVDPHLKQIGASNLVDEEKWESTQLNRSNAVDHNVLIGMGIEQKEYSEIPGKSRKQRQRLMKKRGFIRLTHLPESISHTELEELFDFYKVKIFLDSIVHIRGEDGHTAFIKVSKRVAAFRADELGEVEIQGHKVTVQMISEEQYSAVYSKTMHSRSNVPEPHEMVPENHFQEIPEGQYRDQNAHESHGLVSESQFQGIPEDQYRDQNVYEPHGMVSESQFQGIPEDQYRDQNVYEPHGMVPENQFQGIPEDQYWDQNIYEPHGMVPENQFQGIPEDKYRDQNVYEPHGMVPKNQFQEMLEGQYDSQSKYYGQTIYVQIHNLPKSMLKKGLRKFLFAHQIGYDIVPEYSIVKRYVNPVWFTAYIEASNIEGGLKLLALDGTSILGLVLNTKMISKRTYDAQKTKFFKPSKNEIKTCKEMASTDSYGRLSNIPLPVTKYEIQGFLQSNDIHITKRAIFIDCTSSTVLIKFQSIKSADKVKLLHCWITGELITLEKISLDTYIKEKNTTQEIIDTSFQKGQLAEPDKHGYVMISNLSRSINFSKLMAFIQQVAFVNVKTDIILKVDQNNTTAYVRFNRLQDALKLPSLCSYWQDDLVKVEMVTADEFKRQNLSDTKSNGKSEDKGAYCKRNETHLPNITKPSLIPSTSDKFECFIKLHNLTESTTACEVWNMYGGVHGCSPGVYLVKHEESNGGVCGYIRFSDLQHRNEALVQYESCTALRANKTYEELSASDSYFPIFESTVMGKDHEISDRLRFRKILNDHFNRSDSVVFSSMDKRDSAMPDDRNFLCSMYVTDISADANAWSIWKQYGGTGGHSKGVVVVRDNSGHNLLAFIIFDSLKHRNAALKATGQKTEWNIRETYEYLARLVLHYTIVECTTPGKERELSKGKERILRRRFGLEEYVPLNTADISNVNIVAKLKKCDECDMKSNHQSIFSDLIMGAHALDSKQLYFIWLTSKSMPEGATASGLSRWVAGSAKLSKGGILVCSANGVAVCGFVAFGSMVACKAPLQECEAGLRRTAAMSRRKIVNYCTSNYEIFESSETEQDCKVSEEKRMLLVLSVTKVDGSQEQGTKRKAEETSNNEGILEKERKVEKDKML